METGQQQIDDFSFGIKRKAFHAGSDEFIEEIFASQFPKDAQID